MMPAAPLICLAGATAFLLGLIACKRSAPLAALAAAAGLLAALASLPGAARAPTAAPGLATSGLFVFSHASLGFIALILLSALLILVIAAAYWRADMAAPREEFYLLLLISTLGASALAAAGNFVTLFLGLETMTLPMIGMIAYARHRPAAEEAALKYLILSGLSSAFLLFGIGLVDLATGSLDFLQLLGGAAPDAASRMMVMAGLALLGIGAAFKLSLVPFHVWVPDVYAGAPAPSGAFLAVIAKIAVLGLVIRAAAAAPAGLPADVTDAITILAILSMLVGNLLALLQENIKRILGYSSIAHLGYLLVALLAAGAVGRSATTLYLVAYSLTMIAAFGVIAALSQAGAPADRDRIGDLRGLFWTRPALASVLTLALLSLAGIPPAIGFIAKMNIFAAGIHTALWNLTGIMVVSSVLGLFYYLNIILVMSMPPDAAAPPAAVPVMSRVAMAVIGLPMLVFGIVPQPLISILRAVFG